MIELKVITRKNSTPNEKPKVYFSCYKDDFKYFEDIKNDILDKQDCAIYFLDDFDDIPENEMEDYKLQLSKMQMFVFPITNAFLINKNRSLNLDFEIAKQNHTPILPIMCENGLANLFKEKCGRLQYLNKFKKDETAISYDKKLTDFLFKVFLSEELLKKIKNEFSTHIFLSYRKKDRLYANNTIKEIHNYDFAKDILIWYDEFLTPGEDYSNEIKESLKDSDMVVMIVTPNLVNESNYVMNEEYPDALNLNKKVLPIENVKTNKKLLKKSYKNIPKCVNVKDSKKLAKWLRQILNKQVNFDPLHNYYIGRAYIHGIGVEIDKEKGFNLVRYAEEKGSYEATEYLAYAYRNGDYVKLNTDMAIFYTQKLCQFLRQRANSEPNCMVLLARELCHLLDSYNAQGNHKKVVEFYLELINLQLPSNVDKDLQRNLFYWQMYAGSTVFHAYLKMGDIHMAVSNLGKRKVKFNTFSRNNELTIDEKFLEFELYCDFYEYQIDNESIMFSPENKAWHVLKEIEKVEVDDRLKICEIKLLRIRLKDFFKSKNYIDCIEECKGLLGLIDELGFDEMDVLNEGKYMIMLYLAESYYYCKKIDKAIQTSMNVVNELYTNGQNEEYLFNIILLNHLQNLAKCYVEINDEQKLQEIVLLSAKIGQKINAPQWHYFTGKTEITYDSGARYDGELLCGFKMGYGTNYFTDGCRYDGNWKYNTKSGYGKEFDSAGNNIYEGEWENNLFSGKGKLVNPINGGYYDGEWLFGKKSGFGKFLLPGLFYYEGQFKNNKMNGQGKLFIGNTVYEGNFVNDLRHGYGKEYDKNGNLLYEGEWKENKKLI